MIDRQCIGGASAARARERPSEWRCIGEGGMYTASNLTGARGQMGATFFL